jgi:phosphoribosyl 1,2-cyclic phosphodiesterase
MAISSVIRFSLLGSGSEGNALVVQSGQTHILLDCGFSLSETVSRLARLGLAAERLSAIVVTHEHGDHIAGVARLARKFALPVWLTHGTLRAQHAAFTGLQITEIDTHACFAIGDLAVQPYAVPHDASEPVQFVFGDGSHRLGVLTDAGHVTPHIEQSLGGCDALVLECNHDARMLAEGDYPWMLKQRVGGRFGHLNNEDAAGLLRRLDNSRLQHIVAAHLSSKNNRPELAVAALSAALGCAEGWIAVATQNEGLDWREIA